MSRRIHNLPYNPHLRALARELRKHGTLGEVLLWKSLKKKALGVEFQRQVPIGEYIVDFFYRERMLAIEVDGSGHLDEEVLAHDVKRQANLETMAVRVLRFQETAVWNSRVEIVDTITNWMEDDAGGGVTSPGAPRHPLQRGTLQRGWSREALPISPSR